MCIRDSCYIVDDDFVQIHRWITGDVKADGDDPLQDLVVACLLYTSDAADERSSVDLGGRRIIKKKTRERRRRDTRATKDQENI
mgnify:CR=1 FL=1